MLGEPSINYFFTPLKHPKMIFKTHQLHEEPVLTGCRKPRLLVSRTDRLLWGTYSGEEKKRKNNEVEM